MRVTYQLPNCRVSADQPVLVGGQEGHFWFPHLFRLRGNRILCEVTVTADEAQGDWPAVLFLSEDKGAHWRRVADLETAGPAATRLGPGTMLLMPYENWPSAPGDRRTTRANGTILRDSAQGGLDVEPAEVTFHGFLRDLADYHKGEVALFTNGNLLPTRDGGLLSTVYATFAGETKYDLLTMVSYDRGFFWQFRSVAAVGREIPDAPEGADESSLLRLADGRILCVFRVGSRHEFHRVLSEDEGNTWTRPEAVRGAWSVEPRMVRLENGLIALTGGREGLFLFVCADGEGKTWERVNLGAHHNATYPDAAMHFSDVFLEARETPNPPESTAYTGMVAAGPEEVLIAYDRTGNGWDGAPGPRGAVDAVFVVRVRLERAERGERR